MREQKQFDDSKYRWDIDGLKLIKVIWISIPIIFALWFVVLMFLK